jgi:hypothetical protein
MLIVVTAAAATARVSAQGRGCSAMLRPGDDLGAAVATAPTGAILCLVAGEYGPLAVGERTSPGILLLGEEGAVIAGDVGPAVLIDGAERLALAGLTVRGGVTADRARSLALSGVRVERAEIGVEIGAGSTARLDAVQIEGTAVAGLVVRDATVSATRLAVRDPGAYGVAALGDGAEIVLRDSAIAGGVTAALFAGTPGCAELPVASAAVPLCFYDDLDAAIGEARLSAFGTTVEPGAGTGVLAFPGASVTLETTTVRGRERGGLRAWGATLSLTSATVEDNAAAGIDVRAYPDPRGQAVLRGRLELRRTTVRETRPLGGPVLGDGIVIRGADFSLQMAAIETNDGAGIAISHGARGELRDSDVRNNGGPGLCLATGALMAEGGNLIADNARTSAVCADDEAPEAQGSE